MTLALSITFNVHSTWDSTSFFLRLFKNVLFAFLWYTTFIVIKGSVTNRGIDRYKWQRPFTKGKKASPCWVLRNKLYTMYWTFTKERGIYMCSARLDVLFRERNDLRRYRTGSWRNDALAKWPVTKYRSSVFKPLSRKAQKAVLSLHVYLYPWPGY